MKAKAFFQSLKSLYGVVSFITLIIGSVGVFGISVVIPSVPPWASALVFAVSFILGFLYGSFGSDKMAEIETKKAYETERARSEAEYRAKREERESASKREIEKRRKSENEYFRSLVKGMDFHDKVLLWLIYSGNEYEVDDHRYNPAIVDILKDLESEGYIEPETVDFGVTSYQVTDENRSLIEANEDLFRNAKGKTEEELIAMLF